MESMFAVNLMDGMVKRVPNYNYYKQLKLKTKLRVFAQ